MRAPLPRWPVGRPLPPHVDAMEAAVEAHIRSHGITDRALLARVPELAARARDYAGEAVAGGGDPEDARDFAIHEVLTGLL